MNKLLITWVVFTFSVISTNLLAETQVERHARLYGFGSSTTIDTPCEVDSQHTMQGYINTSVVKRFRESSNLYHDESFVNFRKIPDDIVVVEEQGFYVNDRPTSVYFFPDVREEFETVGVGCAHSFCGWLIKTMCTVKSLTGVELLAYWNKGGTLSYVLKKDFVLWEKIK
ncbi:MAG: hypothetical protein AAGC84_08445 [Pseudomonas sp.]